MASFLFVANGATEGAFLQDVLPGGPMEGNVLKYAVTQGGLFGIALVLAVMLWKVWGQSQSREAAQEERANQREDRLTAALLEVAKASASSAAATTSQTEAVKEFSRVVAACKTAQQFARHHFERGED